MNKQLARGSIVLTILFLAGCGLGSFKAVSGSGNVVTETRNVSNFSAVSLDGVGELTVTQGDTEGLTITAEDNLMPLIKTTVENGTLVIAEGNPQTGEIIRPTKPLIFDVKVKNLNAVTLSGAGNLHSPALKTDKFTLTLSGAGSARLDQLQASDVTTTLSGAGSVDAAGQVSSQKAVLSGLGSYRAGDLKSATAEVQISGAGSAVVWVSDSLTANISGAGSVQYYGTPNVSQNISGAGAIKSLGTK